MGMKTSAVWADGTFESNTAPLMGPLEDCARRAAELGFTLRGDYGLGVFNGQTLKELKRLGFRSATLSFGL